MNTNRVFPRATESFGLVAVVESSRVILPLKGVECEFSIQAGLIEVCLTQIFRQENPKPLDCDYLFPLPADASVYSCKADINGRIIGAKIRERAEAVRLAAEKKAEGRRVVLIESERENLFTLTLNNLQPDDLILVKLKYIQPVRVLADMPSLEIPLCPGIRYIPGNPLIRSNRGRGVQDDTDQVPDASRISPLRVDKEHHDAAYIEIRGTLEAKFVDAMSLMSPSHNIISRAEADGLTVRLSNKDEVPDRDFVLRWKEIRPESLTSRAWIRKHEKESYALLEIHAPKAVVGIDSPMDFYFLVDRSGSMRGVKWRKAAMAVQTCIQTLAKDDRAMVTLFGDQVTDFAEEPLSPKQLITDPNFQNLGQLPLDGGTELGKALSHVLDISNLHSSHRKKNLVLITDAQVGDESGILKIMESMPDFPMHCFGIDVALNDSLLLALARQQRGTFHSLNPSDDVARIVADLAQNIRHPVLHDLRLSEGWEIAAAYIPPLYSGQVYHLSARTNNGQTLYLEAQNGKTEFFSIPLTTHSVSDAAPYLHWCKQRIQRCVAERKQAEAIALSIESNLICPLTAFIAWDETEKVAVAQHDVVQPALAGNLLLSEILQPCFSADNLEHSLFRSTSVGFVNNASHLISRGRPQQQPIEIIQLINSENDFNEPLSKKFITIDERQQVFREIFSQVWTLCFCPQWKPFCNTIQDWAFEIQSEAINRSKLVANGEIPLLEVLEKQLNGAVFDPRNFVSISDDVRQAGYVPQANQIETHLQKISQIQNVIQEKLENFCLQLKATKAR